QWPGSWRERRGLHMFVEFAMAPSLAGLFQSGFWHRLVLQACFFSKAVYHMGAAIGSLHEQAIKSSRGIEDPHASAFALQQYDRSIKLLTCDRPSMGNGTSAVDPGEMLITCILFACFEAMQGKTQQAIFHAMQSRSLLKACEIDERPPYLQLVAPNDVIPIVRRLEMQSKALQGRDTKPSDTTGESVLPCIETIHSLEHAHDTLLNVYTRLGCFCQDVRLEWNPDNMVAAMQEKQRVYVPWLQQWETSFVDFLFRYSNALSTHDMQRAKVLKANHLMSSILAKTDQGSSTYWSDVSHVYEADFRAIVDLSASILNTFTIFPFGGVTSQRFPYLVYGLWVTEPLFFTMSRCDIPEIQRQAAGLLAGMPTSTSTSASSSQRRGSTMSHRSDSDYSALHDQMSNNEWINFARNTRLDAAMATYFGKLPLDSIERPPIYQDALDHFASIVRPDEVECAFDMLQS
ncbi:hypothetical protein K431DRAFT_231753, partial [Polychaeton citri CBS 116435]